MKAIRIFIKVWWVKLVIVLLILIISLTLINYMDLKARELESRDPKKYQVNIIRRSERILKRLAKTPFNETPAVATIIDVESLKKQNYQFYSGAKNGDVVVLYKRVAYIVDEKAQKIVNMGPVYEQ